ncbi:hypothetical protein RAS1_37490 [Phycisphaerae bacterium RAS1]|nr:hypothetical protein RAS1_37490 [Phycisphaerae bacterium RAS1]
MTARRLRAPFAALTLPCLALSSLAQWNVDPAENLKVCGATGWQTVPKLAATADGGCYMGWFDPRSGNYDMYIQRYDRFGHPQFAADGLLVSNNAQNSSLVDWSLIADSSGNAVLVFTDIRAVGDLDVYAYRIAADGTFLWGPNGVTLSSNADFEPAPKAAELSDGSFLFAWARIPSPGDGVIVMQKVDAAGTPQYPGDGVTTTVEATRDQGFCSVVAAESGKYIVSWLRDISTFGSPRHIRCQKFNSDGTPAWGSHVSVFDATSVPIAYDPILRSDGAGGAVLGWHRSSANLFASFVQHLDANGLELFPHNGAEIATLPAGQHHMNPAISYNAASGETIVIYSEQTSNQAQRGVRAQKLSALGARAWGDSGVELRPVDTNIEDFIRCVPSGAGGAIAMCFDAPTGSVVQDRVVAFRLDVNGNLTWPGGERILASQLTDKGRLPVVADGSGGAIALWEDNRNDVTSSVDLYAQNVNANGSLGPLGDLNCDGDVNILDINAFTLALSDPAGYAIAYPDCDILLADVNGDGSADILDINPFIAVLAGS